MIVCQLCSKNQATTHLTELTADGSGHRELHLCAGCIAANQLRLEAGPPPIAEILASKTASEIGDATEAAEAISDPSDEMAEAAPPCPQCGLTFAEFAANNRFGCAHDYSAFHTRIDTLLRRYHGSNQHIGRLPVARIAAADGVSVRRAQLDAALREAVSSENYERAAQLRDELRRLGGETSATGSDAPPAGSPLPGGAGL